MSKITFEANHRSVGHEVGESVACLCIIQKFIRKSRLLALMQDSFDLQSIIKKYPELLYASLAVLSYIASVFFAVREMGGARDFNGIEIHIISTPLWLIFGFLSLYFLYTAFFDMWIYAIHLIFTYYLTGTGIVAMYVFYDNITIRAFAFILVIAGLGFVGYFIYRIGNVRSYRIINSPDPETARDRFSLESWYIFPFLFFIITSLSFYDLGRWYDNPSHTPYLHVLMEIALILTLVYILWKPENALFYGTKEFEDSTPWPEVSGPDSKPAHAGQAQASGRERTAGEGSDTPLASLESRIRRKRPIENCPGFDTPPVQSTKSCPACSQVNTFDWCPQSEEYLITCPDCGQRTYHGRKVCIHCKSRLSEEIGCSSCGKEYPIRRFKEAP